jgi:hypothetical protein
LQNKTKNYISSYLTSKKEILKLEMLKNDNTIVKCSHCRKILSTKAFDQHKCDLSLVGNKEISVIYYIDTSYNHKKSITAWGTDGILYTFQVVPRRPIPFVLTSSDGSYHEPSNRRKVNRTSFQFL